MLDATFLVSVFVVEGSSESQLFQGLSRYDLTFVSCQQIRCAQRFLLGTTRL